MPLTPFHFLQAPPELHAPSPCSDHSKPDSDNEPSEHNSDSQEAESQPPTPCSEERRDAAIRILQAQWKAHRHKVSFLVPRAAAENMCVCVFHYSVCFACPLSTLTHPSTASHPWVHRVGWLTEGGAVSTGPLKGEVIYSCNPSTKEDQEFKVSLSHRTPSLKPN